MSKREELLDQAVRLFSLQGYANVGVQELVESAGVTKPTLYHYFGSKAGLLRTLMEERSRDFLTRLEGATAYQRDLVKSLMDTALCWFEFALQDEDFVKLTMISPWEARESEFARILEEYKTREYGLLEKMFKEAEEQHGNMKGRSRRYAMSFYGMIQTYIGFYFTNRREIKLDRETAYTACHQFMHGIFS